MPIEGFKFDGDFLALLVLSYKYWKLSHIKLECTMKEKSNNKTLALKSKLPYPPFDS